MDKETIAYVIQTLRWGTITWPRRTECLNKTRVRKLIGSYKNGKPKFKYYYYCAYCKQEFDSPEYLEVDHIKEIGPFKGDFTEYIERMYCSIDNLQNLCSVCHQIKTSNFNSTLKYTRKKLT